MPYLHWNIIGCAKTDRLKGLDLIEINSAILPYCAVLCLCWTVRKNWMQESQYVVGWPIDLNEFLIHRMLT
jgi:hypothetical protein